MEVVQFLSTGVLLGFPMTNVLLGSEKVGGGFGGANAYLTQTVNGDGGGDDDTTVPVITLKGDAEITHEAATDYNDRRCRC